MSTVPEVIEASTEEKVEPIDAFLARLGFTDVGVEERDPPIHVSAWLSTDIGPRLAPIDEESLESEEELPPEETHYLHIRTAEGAFDLLCAEEMTYLDLVSANLEVRDLDPNERELTTADLVMYPMVGDYDYEKLRKVLLVRKAAAKTS